MSTQPHSGTTRPPRTLKREHWCYEEVSPGRLCVHLDSFAYFDEYIRALSIVHEDFIWRGHSCDAWRLVSSLDRLRLEAGFDANQELAVQHLMRFKRAARGRRGANPAQLSENEWWALAQHSGLSTPLLDWSFSPFVAAYFSFSSGSASSSERAAVFGLSRYWVRARSRARQAAGGAHDAPEMIEFVDPLNHDNARMLAQDGVFTRVPEGLSIEEWVSGQVGPDELYVRLLKITFPRTEQSAALNHLRRMNISHSSLFPDLSGAAATTNLDYRTQGGYPTFRVDEHLLRDKGKEPRSPLSPLDAAPDFDREKSSVRNLTPILSPGQPIRIIAEILDSSGAVVEGDVRLETEQADPPNPFADWP